MPFNSYRFLVFLVVVLAAYNVAPARARQYLLLLASYVFYANAYPPYLGLLIFVTATAYIGANIVATHRRRSLLITFIICTLLPLLTVKYVDLFARLVNHRGLRERLGLVEIIIPIGISFYTLQAVSYIVDVYRGSVKPDKHLPKVALYIAFFPQLLSGPIERSGRLLPQLYRLSKSTSLNLYVGMKYLAWGFFCKLVVADNVGLIVDRVLTSPMQESGGSLAATFAMYSFQLYFDFLGYTTIAIGVARFFGVQLSHNFDAPYCSTSLRDFWRRWHITLSSWWRDYLYVPLGGTATRGARRAGQMLTVFLISGLWHGAAWNFLAWGGFHGTAYLVEEQLRRRLGPANGRTSVPVVRWGRIALTFGVVTLAWVFFRLSDVLEIRTVIERMLFIRTDVPYVSLNPVLMRADTFLFLGILLTAVLLDSSRRARLIMDTVPQTGGQIITELMFVNWLVVALVLLGDRGSREFIYFRF